MEEEPRTQGGEGGFDLEDPEQVHLPHLGKVVLIIRQAIRTVCGGALVEEEPRTQGGEGGFALEDPEQVHLPHLGKVVSLLKILNRFTFPTWGRWFRS